MRAVVLRGKTASFTSEYPRPIPLENQVRVRVLSAGVCETDLQLIQGYMGFAGVLGHEFVGVAESGPFAGRRVVGEINSPCLRCPTCLAGRPTHCPHRTVLGILNHDGAFADELLLPQSNLHLVPDNVSTQAAVFTEPLAAAFQILEQVTIGPTDRVVVVGDGRLGQLCACVLATRTPHVSVIGKHAGKLARLQRRGMATRLLVDVGSTFASPEDRVDVVIECTGRRTGLETALRLVRPRGTVVLKTTVAGPHTLSLAPVVIDELTIVGSRCGPFSPALQALAEKRIDVEEMIAAEYPLEEAVRALEHAAQPGVLKVLLNIGNA
jgi:threonine dehydrogenase-like Zn-dependent dehydrogenase